MKKIDRKKQSKHACGPSADDTTGIDRRAGLPRVVMRDAAQGRWLEFTAPSQIIATCNVNEVLPLLRKIEAAVEGEGLHGAGFISYEAAPAFDPSLPAKADGDFPLLWFGLFQEVKAITLVADGAGTADLNWQPSVTAEEYHRCLGALRSYIADGDTYLTNFTYRLHAETDVDPWELFVGVAGDGASPYAAFVDTGDWAICSASPELFLSLDGDRIESCPMKGTAARGLWYEDDLARREALVSSPKERAENLMITDMVRNDFSQVAKLGSVQVSSFCTAEQYPTVWQMTSTIRARTDQPLHRILQATFPPASVTGAPRRRTMEIIAELEATPRRVYTGTIGFLSPGRHGRFNVAIRTVLLQKGFGKAEYGVGGGIVWDSDSEAEYRECLTKTRVLQPGPRNFDLLETILWSPGDGYALLDYHLLRLGRSAEYFGFAVDPDRVRQTLATLADGLSPASCRVRLLVSRQGNIEVTKTILNQADMVFGDIALANIPVDRENVFLYHKTTRRQDYESALKAFPGRTDVLLFNGDGEVTESTIANVAVEIDGGLWTPPVRCGLLPGTQRAWLLDQGHLRERVITVEELQASPAIYLLNSVRGKHRVRLVTDQRERKETA